MFEVRQGLCKVRWRCWLTVIFADLDINERLLTSSVCWVCTAVSFLELPSLICNIWSCLDPGAPHCLPFTLGTSLSHPSLPCHVTLSTSNVERFIFSHKPSCMYSILSAQTFLFNCPEGQCEESGSFSSQLSRLAASVVLWISLLQFFFF